MVTMYWTFILIECNALNNYHSIISFTETLWRIDSNWDSSRGPTLIPCSTVVANGIETADTREQRAVNRRRRHIAKRWLMLLFTAFLSNSWAHLLRLSSAELYQRSAVQTVIYSHSHRTVRSWPVAEMTSTFNCGASLKSSPGKIAKQPLIKWSFQKKIMSHRENEEPPPRTTGYQ